MRKRTAFLVTLLSVGILTSPAKAIETSSAEVCKLQRQFEGPINPGFPRDQYRLPESGTVRGIFLFVDFTDIKRNADPKQISRYFTTETSKFINDQSFGKVKLLFDTFPSFIKINKPSTSYGFDVNGKGNGQRILSDAVAAADPLVDFTPYDFVIVIPPLGNKTFVYGGAMSFGPAGFVSAEKEFSSGVVIGSDKLRDFNSPGNGWSMMAHEIGHLYGFEHPYSQKNSGPWHGVTWDIMGNGGTSTPSFMGWNRFLAGWLGDNQVLCLQGAVSGSHFANLTAMSTLKSGPKLLLIQLSSTQAVAIEGRRKSNYDKLGQYEEGAIAYLVDVTKKSDEGSFQMLGNKTSTHEDQLMGTLRKGDSFTYKNIKIKVMDSSKTQDKVQITIFKR